jgi:hypothetical protein
VQKDVEVQLGLGIANGWSDRNRAQKHVSRAQIILATAEGGDHAPGRRFYTVVDLVNRLEGEARASRQGRLADYLTAWTSLCSTNSAISLSPRAAANCSFTWSVGSTSAPQ